MPQPTVREGHFDVLLSNISVAYVQDAKKFIAGQVFPVVPVDLAASYYLEFPRGAFFREEVGPRPLGGYSRMSGFHVIKNLYNCEEQSEAMMLDDRQRANAVPPYDPERTYTTQLTEHQLIHRDKDFVARFFGAGIWTNDLSGGTAVANYGATNGVLRFWDQANSTPIEDVDLYRDRVEELTGFRPNKIILGRSVFRALKNHPEILDRLKYTQRGVLTTDLLAAIWGVDDVLIPGGVQNTGQEGLADAFSFIFGKGSALMVYAAPNPGIEIPSAGYIFSWRGLLGAAGFEAAIWRGRDERAHSDWFEVRMAYDMHKIGADLGVMFSNIVSSV